MTLNGVMAVILRYSTECSSSRSGTNNTSVWWKIDSYYLRRKCGPKNLVFLQRMTGVCENEFVGEVHDVRIDNLITAARYEANGARQDAC